MHKRLPQQKALDYSFSPSTKIRAKIVAMSLLKKGVMNQTMVRNDQIKKP
jgi:hypothetical protein